MFGVRQSFVIGGLSAFAGLLLAALFMFSSFESDLSIRSQRGLADAGHTWATVKLTGREAVLTGLAPTPADREAAVALVQSTYGVRTTTDQMELLPEEKPYITSFERDGNLITVTGNLPSDASKNALPANLTERIEGIGVSDLTTLARGAPEDHAALSTFSETLLEHLDPATITLTDSTIRISGDAIDFDNFDAVNDALENAKPETLEISELNVRAPRVSPFTWSALVDGDAITLDGFVPFDGLPETLELKMTELMPSAQITNNLRLARGMPDGVDFEPISQYALERIAELGIGQALLSDTTLTITGRAKDPEAYDRVAALMDVSPSEGFVLTGTDIKRPLIDPYVFKIENMGSSFRMTGFLPDPEAKARVLENANIAALRAPIEDEIKFGDGAPENIEGLAVYAINTIPLLDKGSIGLDGSEVTVNGEAFHQGAQVRLTDQVSGTLPEGFDLLANITVKEAPADLDDQGCVLELQRTLSESSIQFETSSARINPDSFFLLDNIVFLTRRCPDTRFEVAGHTDSDGRDAVNQRLSEARAASVATYLVEAGIPEERLFPIGYGESQPIASNNTAAGKAQNRRIEFSLYVPPPPEDDLLPEETLTDPTAPDNADSADAPEDSEQQQ